MGPPIPRTLRALRRSPQSHYHGNPARLRGRPSPADDRFRFLWPKLRELRADIGTNIAYATPIWFLASAHRYDDYDAQRPKCSWGNTPRRAWRREPQKPQQPGMRPRRSRLHDRPRTQRGRGAHGVLRPLFAHVDAWQWTPDLSGATTSVSAARQTITCNNSSAAIAGRGAARPAGRRGPSPSRRRGRIGLGTNQTGHRVQGRAKSPRRPRAVELRFFGEPPGLDADERSMEGPKTGALAANRHCAAKARSPGGDPSWSDIR